ncbi:MAG: hypothetical protein J7L39_03615 [Candidatus Aenigmarchaeota archaeon]|nr:hypothetical protein [Candidatus Aenigmarchaeota archaeon]
METVLQILNTFLDQTINFIPNLIAAAILLVIGWIIGTVIGKITREILKRLRIDEYISKKKKPLFRASDILAIIFEWAIYLVFIQSAVGVLGIPALESFFEGIISFIPGLVKAIVVIMVGYAIAEYVTEKVKESKVVYSNILSSILFFLVIYISIALALPLVGIDPFIVNAILIVILGSIGLGLAIAIGWGLKDVIASLAKKYARKFR